MKNVILAGICLKEDQRSFQSKMDECTALCRAIDYNVVSCITQNARSMDPKFAFRKGKLDELAALVQEEQVSLIVFYNALSVQIAQRIAEVCDCEVIDRTALILDIFSMRARSRQAKLQTELARLQYDLPRVLNSDNDRERERGGTVNNRGSGEMRSQIIARKYQRRIQDLKQELEKIETRRNQDERRRNKILLQRAALIGYTNAGKSSFMNQLLKANTSQGTTVYEEDMLFATLDTSVRRITYDHKAFLLYDTVGFVSDLPHELIDAFHSTLQACKEADLLIHIIDASDPEYQNKIEVTENTLKEIGAQDVPVLRIYNKIDLLEDISSIDDLCVSAFTGFHMEQAVQTILKRLYPEEECMTCLLPYDRISLFDEYRSVLDIDVASHNEDGMLLTMKGPSRYIRVFDAFRLEGGMNFKNE